MIIAPARPPITPARMVALRPGLSETFDVKPLSIPLPLTLKLPPMSALLEKISYSGCHAADVMQQMAHAIARAGLPSARSRIDHWCGNELQGDAIHHDGPCGDNCR